MSAFLQQSIFRAKFDEKSHVFWDIDFKAILDGFWEGFGRPKSSIFVFFSMNFSKSVSAEQKIDPRGPTRRRRWIFGPGFRLSPASWGKKIEGIKSLGLHQELGLSDSPFVIGQDVSESDLVCDLACPAHLRWAADLIENPQGGPPPPPLLCPGLCDRILDSWHFWQFLHFLAFLAF